MTLSLSSQSTRDRGGDRRHAHGREALKFLSISDALTGVALYQHKWINWCDAKEQGSIGKLVQSFYQFARMVSRTPQHLCSQT